MREKPQLSRISAAFQLQLLLFADAKRDCGEAHVTTDRPKVSVFAADFFLPGTLSYRHRPSIEPSGTADFHQVYVSSDILYYCAIDSGRYYCAVVVGAFSALAPPRVCSFATSQTVLPAMSDDEEYYDEFDDIFWIEEPEPDAAVSLSIHRFKRPVIPCGRAQPETNRGLMCRTT